MAAAKGEGDGLEFDKDDQIAMNFVAAASNLRSRVFQVGKHVSPKLEHHGWNTPALTLVL